MANVKIVLDMDKRTQELLDRTFRFGVDTLTFLYKLKYNEVFGVPKKQLVRSSTSIGANYEESQAAESKKDFVHKIGIVCKECRESHYWIRVLKAVYEDETIKEQLNIFEQEAFEFKKIFIAIKLSAEGKRNSTSNETALTINHQPLAINH